MNASPPQCSFLVVKRCNCQNKITFLTAAKFNSCGSLCSPPIIRQPEAEEERLLATDSSYASVQKFGVGKIFVMFIKKGLLCSPRLHVFIPKYSKISNVATYCFNSELLYI